MTTLKRYSLTGNEEPSGEYVNAEEALTLIADLEAELREVREEAANARCGCGV